MKIAVDIDDVLLDFNSKFCEYFNHQFKTNYCKKDINKWNFYTNWNVSRETINKIYYKIYKNDILPLIDIDIINILDQLNKIYNIDLVTAKSSNYKSELIRNLEIVNINKDLHYNEILMVNDKPYDLKCRLNYDIYIDDNPNLVRKIRKNSKKVLFLFHQPWNKEVEEHDNIIRISNWNEIKNHLIHNIYFPIMKNPV